MCSLLSPTGGLFQGWESEAVASAVEEMSTLAATAASARVSAPPGGWPTWRKRLQQLAHGIVDDAWSAEISAEQAPQHVPLVQLLAADSSDKQKVIHQLRLRLLQVEQLLYSATGEGVYHQASDADDGGDADGGQHAQQPTGDCHGRWEGLLWFGTSWIVGG